MNKMNKMLSDMDTFISDTKNSLLALSEEEGSSEEYVEKLEQFENIALKLKNVISKEIKVRYNNLIQIEENPKVAELRKQIDDLGNVENFNELNTAFEKLGIDRICQNLSCFYEGDFRSLNTNIKSFIEIFESLGIKLTENDFYYSQFTNEYMKAFFEEKKKNTIYSNVLKEIFDQIYWKCPNIVMHLELNIRYLYYINANKIEKKLSVKNEKMLNNMKLDKNGLVNRFFELNKDLIQAQKCDYRFILNNFIDEKWKQSDYNEDKIKELYKEFYAKDYYSSSKEEKEEIDANFEKLLNTLEEYRICKRFKYILDDLNEKYKIKDTFSFKGDFENKNRILRKKEAALLKETKKNRAISKNVKNPIFIFFKRNWEHKIYEFPVLSNSQIKEIKQLYDELDLEKVQMRVLDFVDDNCSLKYMFKIAISYYVYVYSLINKHFENRKTSVEIDSELEILQKFIDQPYKVMVNNIKLFEQNNIESIIINRYKLLNINIQEKDLQDENLDDYISKIEIIVNNYYILKSGFNLDDATFIKEATKINSISEE